VETPEERRAKAIANIMRETDDIPAPLSEDDQLDYGLSGCRSDAQLHPGVAESNGSIQQEPGYSWTQTDEELEVTLKLPDINVGSKEVEVKFRPRHLYISYRNELLVDLELFEAIDADGSTWTLDKSGDATKIVLTMEKVEQALWARIKD
jgi:HSP20 family molecular chaperone IbpA